MYLYYIYNINIYIYIYIYIYICIFNYNLGQRLFCAYLVTITYSVFCAATALTRYLVHIWI